MPCESAFSALAPRRELWDAACARNPSCGAGLGIRRLAVVSVIRLG